MARIFLGERPGGLNQRGFANDAGMGLSVVLAEELKIAGGRLSGTLPVKLLHGVQQVAG